MKRFLVLTLALSGLCRAAENTTIEVKKVNIGHTNSVERISYNPYEKIVASASVDQSVGIWSWDLDSTGKYRWGTQNISIVNSEGQTMLAQISDLSWAYTNQKSYLLLNLMGTEIHVYSLDEQNQRLNKENSLNLGRKVISTRSWKVIPYTSFVMIGGDTTVEKINFLTNEVAWSKPVPERQTRFCILNSEEMIMSTGKKLQLVDIAQGTTIATQPITSAPLYIVSLSGLNSATDSEIAVSLPGAKLDIYVYTQITYGLVRSYPRLHGFYESMSLAPIAYTSYALSISHSNKVVIFDIVHANPLPQVVASHVPYTYGANSVEYLKNTNTFFVCYSGGFDNIGLNVERIARLTFCDDPRCIECAPRSYCKKCAIAWVVDKDEDLNTCVDCSSPQMQGSDKCATTRRYSLSTIDKQSSEFGREQVPAEYGVSIHQQLTSAMVRINIERILEVKQLMKYSKLSPLNSKFRFTIDGLTQQTDYVYHYLVKEGQIYLALNFTVDVSSTTLRMYLIDPVLLEMQTTQTSVLLFNETQTVVIDGYAVTDQATVKAFTTTSTTVATIAAAAVATGGIFAAVSLCFSMGFLASFFSFFQIIQVGDYNLR